MTGNRISEVTCPVCTQFGKGDIRFFHSEWTLSWHIAYEAKMCTGGDQLHRKWVDRNCGELNFKEYNIKEIHKLTKVVYPLVKELRVNAIHNPEDILLIKATRLEGELRSFVEKVLRKELEDKWWYDGVPDDIREKAVVMSEKNKGRKPPFAYTYIIDMLKIVDQKWPNFVPFVRAYYRENEKSRLKSKIDRLNNIRNDQTHNTYESKQWGEDLEFITEFEKEINIMCKGL